MRKQRAFYQNVDSICTVTRLIHCYILYCCLAYIYVNCSMFFHRLKTICQMSSSTYHLQAVLISRSFDFLGFLFQALCRFFIRTTHYSEFDGLHTVHNNLSAILTIKWQIISEIVSMWMDFVEKNNLKFDEFFLENLFLKNIISMCIYLSSIDRSTRSKLPPANRLPTMFSSETYFNSNFNIPLPL